MTETNGQSEPGEAKPVSILGAPAEAVAEGLPKLPKRNQRIRQRISAALQRQTAADTTTPRLPGLALLCSLCGHKNFSVGEYVPLGMSKSPQTQGVFSPQVYPCITIICKTCGNTYLMNLRILGFSEADWADLTFAESEDAD